MFCCRRASLGRVVTFAMALTFYALPSLTQAQSPPDAQSSAPADAATPADAAAPPDAQVSAAPAGSGFTVVGDQVEPRTGWRHVHSRYPLPKAGGLAGLMGLGGARWFTAHTIVLTADHYSARLVDQPSPSLLTAPPISELTRRAKAQLGVNGGYFDTDFNPVGLYVLGGVVRRPYRERQLLSGTVVIGRSGQLTVRTRSEPYQDAVYALQCGPLIIDPGGEIGIKNAPGPEARRTVLGIGATGELAVISTTAVSLRTLAEALHDNPGGFGVSRIERALNLDGGPSTAMTALFTTPPLQLEAQTPVRTALVFFARPQPSSAPAKATKATKSTVATPAP